MRHFSHFLSSLCLCASVVQTSSAHPVPSDNHDRTIVVRLTAEAVYVDYRLELDELRAQRDLPRSEIAKIASRTDFYNVFTLNAAGDLAAVKPGNETVTEAEAPLPPPRTLLHLLLDERRGLAAALLLAAFFGAAHALTPGHGKTLVAAYLVGQRGTVWHALLLGLVTTFTHTGTVLAVALGLVLLFPEAVPADIQMVLGFGAGLLVAGLGFWLLLKR